MRSVLTDYEHRSIVECAPEPSKVMPHALTAWNLLNQGSELAECCFNVRACTAGFLKPNRDTEGQWELTSLGKLYGINIRQGMDVSVRWFIESFELVLIVSNRGK